MPSPEISALLRQGAKSCLLLYVVGFKSSVRGVCVHKHTYTQRVWQKFQVLISLKKKKSQFHAALMNAQILRLTLEGRLWRTSQLGSTVPQYVDKALAASSQSPAWSWGRCRSAPPGPRGLRRWGVLSSIKTCREDYRKILSCFFLPIQVGSSYFIS